MKYPPKCRKCNYELHFGGFLLIYLYYEIVKTGVFLHFFEKSNLFVILTNYIYCKLRREWFTIGLNVNKVDNFGLHFEGEYKDFNLLVKLGMGKWGLWGVWRFGRKNIAQMFTLLIWGSYLGADCFFISVIDKRWRK